MKIRTVLLTTALFLFAFSIKSSAQDFYFGNDLSYVNQMEDCGADFKEWGQSKDVYQIYADRGNNLVRVRLWVDPIWQRSLEQPEGVKEVYSNFEDVRETIQRSKEAGMHVLLDFHYSDFWADPGRQVLPNRWYFVGPKPDDLADSVYNYTYRVLDSLDNDGLMPEMVQIGNETNSGMMRHRSMDNEFEGQEFLSDDWSRHAKLFNAGIKAVRDVSAGSEINTKVALHFAGIGNDLDWWYENAIDYGITDFDVIGFSYYYAWHGSSIQEVGSQIERLANDYPGKEIIILETGYPWTNQNFDNSGNIINEVTEAYSPASPAIQLAYLVDLTKEVMSSGGDGVIFWESAWVTTPCTTPWAQGSSHDHVVFFEPFTNNFMANGGGLWMDSTIYEDMQSVQAVFKVKAADQDTSDGIYITGDFDGTGSMHTYRLYDEGNDVYSYTTYVSPGTEGSYYYHTGEGGANRETVPGDCSDGTNRTFTVESENIKTGFGWGTCTSITGQQEPSELTVTFAVDMTGHDTSDGVFVTGDFTRVNGSDWSIEPMEHVVNNIYVYETEAEAGDEGGYYFLDGNDWNDRETVPEECVGYYNADRGYFIENESVTYAFEWGSCTTFDYGKATPLEDEEEIPGQGTLYQNYPNPFNPSTLITYQIQSKMAVDLSLFNLLGQKVRTLDSGVKSPGTHYVNFDAEGLPTGTYVYRLTTEEFSQNKKLILIK